MANLLRRYVEAVRDVFGPGYWATWQPSVRMSLGDIGVVEHGAVVQVDKLADQGLAFDVHPASTEDSVTYRSDDGIRVTFKAAGEAADKLFALTAADAGAVVDFGHNGGVLLDLSG